MVHLVVHRPHMKPTGTVHSVSASFYLHWTRYPKEKARICDMPEEELYDPKSIIQLFAKIFDPFELNLHSLNCIFPIVSCMLIKYQLFVCNHSS